MRDFVWYGFVPVNVGKRWVRTSAQGKYGKSTYEQNSRLCATLQKSAPRRRFISETPGSNYRTKTTSTPSRDLLRRPFPDYLSIDGSLSMHWFRFATREVGSWLVPILHIFSGAGAFLGMDRISIWKSKMFLVQAYRKGPQAREIPDQSCYAEQRFLRTRLLFGRNVSKNPSLNKGPAFLATDASGIIVKPLFVDIRDWTITLNCDLKPYFNLMNLHNTTT